MRDAETTTGQRPIPCDDRTTIITGCDSTLMLFSLIFDRIHVQLAHVVSPIPRMCSAFDYRRKGRGFQCDRQWLVVRLARDDKCMDEEAQYRITLLERNVHGAWNERHPVGSRTVSVPNVERLAAEIITLITNEEAGDLLCGAWYDIMQSLLVERLGNRLPDRELIEFGRQADNAVTIERLGHASPSERREKGTCALRRRISIVF